MADERFRLVEQLYHDALDLPAAERPHWLASACGADDALRREVEALLHYDTADGDFLERSALSTAVAALARDHRDRQVGRRLGSYEVLAFLGAGGMGDVYRARDVRLRREVALKVFEHAASLEPINRIEAEARAASALNHPNIVTVYGVGEDGDTAYIAMELVHGRSLRDLLSEAPLPEPQALDIAVQLAEAVSAAHACGIVHRDLKPENVMVSPEGRVKVLDFGIATQPHEYRPGDEAAAERVETRGALVGTVGYMSPEQARERGAVPASDQFALAIICHEMLTGKRLFARATAQETLDAIASDDEVPSLELGSRLAPLEAVLARCLAKDPARRYGDSAQLARALRGVKRDLEHVDVLEGPTRRRLMSLGAFAALGALTAGAAWQLWPRPTPRRSLAVLPFGNPAGDENTEYLCDGITETLIRQLAEQPSVRVMARATSFAFKGRREDPRTVGRRLGVDATLSGEVTRRAGRVLVSAELVETATGVRLWGADFDRPAGDVLDVQHEIAGAILGAGHLGPAGQQRRSTLGPTDDPAAFELFLQAVHHLRLATEEDYLAARDLLVRAVDRDPRFALALVTLASTYSVMTMDGYAAPADAWRQADLYVARALEVDADLADAHAEAASAAFFYRWDWREAERRWTAALRLRNEVQSELLTAYSLQKWALGQTRAALELAQAARTVDPLSAQASLREADLLSALGRLEEAAGAYERVIGDEPGDPRAYFGLAELRRKQGRIGEAIDVRRRAHATLGDDSLDPLFARARGAAGYGEIVRASARRELEQLARREASGGYVSPLDFARAFAQLGDADRAFGYLSAALEERAAGVVLLRVDPAWDAVRDDARFTAAVARVGFPWSAVG